MKKTTFCIIGSGWRAEFFARCAKALPEHFELLGFVTRNAQKADAFLAAYGVPGYESIDLLLARHTPDFVVLSIIPEAMPAVLSTLTRRGLPVLLETPAGASMDALLSTFAALPQGAKVQVAEQYFLRPVQQAHLRFMETQKLGHIQEARVCMTNDYHSISLLRKYLNVGFENATIRAHQFSVSGYQGYERSGVPAHPEVKTRLHTLAILEFPNGVAIHDYEDMQHRSFIRTSQVQIKGTRGEICGNTLRYLDENCSPITSAFLRKNLGEDENIEGYGLKGILADGQWVYHNPFPDARLADDEIAVAQCMVRMAQYVQGGEGFYSYAQAAQDMYLSLLIRQACQEDRAVTSQTQPWAEA